MDLSKVDSNSFYLVELLLISLSSVVIRPSTPFFFRFSENRGLWDWYR